MAQGCEGGGGHALPSLPSDTVPPTRSAFWSRAGSCPDGDENGVLQSSQLNLRPARRR